ncbi:MAG: DUF1631 family protein [Burkholderiaceae bacterium]
MIDATHVERSANAIRQRSTELKNAATTSSEKATIEVVALDVSEHSCRGAHSRLGACLVCPPADSVLRVALAEPEFFRALQHPARKLIDRMGSCVMGFETGVGAAALETEIKRVVQVIEQYPETGRRVFQLVYDEFQKFLSTYLASTATPSVLFRLPSRSNKGDLVRAIHHRRLRKLLDDVPVRDEIREFSSRWVEARR